MTKLVSVAQTVAAYTVTIEAGRLALKKGLKLSKGSSKMEGIRSLNSSPLTNKFCQKMSKGNSVCAACYSMKSLRTYRQNCHKPWNANGDILTSEEFPVESFPYLNENIFRIHSHGELINRRHCRNIFRLALRNPDTIFGFWTKRRDIVNGCGIEVPANVILIYSNPTVDRVVKKVPKGFHKVFNVITEEHAERNGIEINCGARNCLECQRCYRFDTTSVIVEKKK